VEAAVRDALTAGHRTADLVATAGDRSGPVQLVGTTTDFTDAVIERLYARSTAWPAELEPSR
jgi:hypothetical protein